MNQLPHCNSCPFFVKTIQSCPTQSLNPFQSNFITAFWQFLLQIGSFTPYFFVFGLIVYIVMTKDKSKVNLFCCLLFQNFISVTFKAIIQQPRPQGACSESFGFPSSHASFGSSLWLYIILQNCSDKKSKSKSMINMTTIIYTIYLILVVISRYILNYHTPVQLFVGFIIGIASTIAMRKYGDSLLKILSRGEGGIKNSDDQDNKLYQDVENLQRRMNDLENISKQVREVTYSSEQRIKKLKQKDLINGDNKLD